MRAAWEKQGKTLLIGTVQFKTTRSDEAENHLCSYVKHLMEERMDHGKRLGHMRADEKTSWAVS